MQRREIRNRNKNIIANPLDSIPQQKPTTRMRIPQPAQTTPLPALQNTHLPLWGAPARRPSHLNYHKWTDAEDTFLQSLVHYQPVPWFHITRVLPHRTRSAISQRMAMLKALVTNVRLELDLALSGIRKHRNVQPRAQVEVIVIDDDDEPTPASGLPNNTVADTSYERPVRDHVHEPDVGTVIGDSGGDRGRVNGNSERVMAEDGCVTTRGVDAHDVVDGVTERDRDVRQGVVDGGVPVVRQERDESSDDETRGLVGERRIAELLKDEEYVSEEDEEEEFVFVAPDRPMNETFSRCEVEKEDAELVHRRDDMLCGSKKFDKYDNAVEEGVVEWKDDVGKRDDVKVSCADESKRRKKGEVEVRL